MDTAKKIFFWCLVGFVIIQFVPIDRINRPVKKAVNFVDSQKSPEKIKNLIKTACYDCHSDETVYPKYAYIAPLSWSIKDHVNEGRERINFSIWGTYNKDLKESMLTKSIQTINNKSMPLPGYIVYHKDANLSDAERSLLTQYFEGLLKSKSY
ncbi:cytochrome C [Chryseobacterium nematophagum]|uniref:Cytochrome C n=1 Tax=Chryseobacterium nematophagum TaxID=2305228 RepID=A0A3M7TGB1_9FLAO|nr:heme-binding domain-containing protein [Chryseobacterium nematophagum]RNA61250.1 cytochrome C [Chryseobacterium nematophagum]